ncbi:hypothetical protein EPO33_04835 [Patescibacteria group bacterium]|nr:MAG: hypothetical protein EPO33_04835 [Patescibacteria group bacterium]
MQPLDFVIILMVTLSVVLVVTAAFGLFVGVPFIRTPKHVVREMIRLAHLRGGEHVMDLGAGDGSILLAAKNTHPSITAMGVELVPTVWLLGRLRIALSGHAITYLRRDMRSVPVGNADVIFLYTFPHIMAYLEPKFEAELRPGTVVISHAFAFPRRQPTEVVTLGSGFKKKRLLRYEW